MRGRSPLASIRTATIAGERGAGNFRKRRRPIALAAVLGALAALLPALAAGTEPGKPFRDCAVCPEMVVVPARPKAFAIGRHEVTFAEWDACVAAGGCAAVPDDHGWGRGRRPVINVSWRDAGAYAGWLSRRTGARYRLPTEAEWESAARAGTRTAYWWGDSPGNGRANCRGCGGPWDGRMPAPVGFFDANSFGLYDVHGNVWEWTAECWEDAGAVAPCPKRVVRGGAWYYVARASEAGSRSGFAEAFGSYMIGIRLVRELP